MVGVQALLYEIELDLKRSAPAESAALREASLQRLRGAMRPPAPVVEFPAWRRPAYGIAATILMAALGGYMVLNSPPGALDDGGEPRQSAALEPTAAVSLPDPLGSSRPIAAAPAAQVPAPSAEAAAKTQTVERFRIDFAAAPPLPRPAELVGQAPALELVGNGVPSSLAFVNPSESAGPILPPLAARPMERFDSAPEPATVETASILVEGHWLLAQAGVWQEDLRPEHRNGRLYFVGTVEDEASYRRVSTALGKTAGSTEIAFDLRSRDAEKTAIPPAAPSGAHPSQRPSGGMVRTSLLSHFGDAARRSFQPLEPSLLEAELDRYVSGVFRGQSRLLAHAYALQVVLSGMERTHVDSFPPETRQRLREVIRLHWLALRDEEAHLYDRLSEVLPRRYWAYRVDKSSAQAETDWLDEGQAILDDALRLDSMLTSLFGAAPATVRADQPHLSCGELLAGLRSHLAHLKRPLDSLQ